MECPQLKEAGSGGTWGLNQAWAPSANSASAGGRGDSNNLDRGMIWALVDLPDRVSSILNTKEEETTGVDVYFH